MFELIPSEYMRKVLQHNQFSLTDFNRATLIWNQEERSREEVFSALEELARDTDDAVLKQQIMERLDYENKMLEKLQNNDGGRYVYVVLDDSECSCGFFLTFHMAYEYGIEYSKNGEEDSFSIEKQLIITDQHDLTVRDGGRTNWNFFPEEKKIQMKKYDGAPVSQVYFTSAGKIKRIWSNEMTEEAEAVVDSYRSDRFEFQFFRIPFEGTIGWKVRDTRDGSHGILMQDTDGWKKYIESIEKKGRYVDFSDIQVEVVFLTPQGSWSHEHINPIYLEPDRYFSEEDSEEARAKGRAMECFSEYWFRKSKDSGNLISYEKQVIKSAREYRDACLKKQIEKEKKKCRIVDRAKSVYDLII